MIVAPAMIFAGQATGFSALISDYWCAPMTTGVVKRIDGPGISMNDNDWLPGIVPEHVAARLRYFVDMRGQQPGFPPDIFPLQLVEAGVCIPAGRNVG